eukprot:SAG22_NODE_5004_length_1110_cov_1.346192_2_plen_134_part_00
MAEMIRDGKQVYELMLLGKELLGLRQVLPGVAADMHEIQVEGTFPDGTKLLTVHNPICNLDGDMSLALYGSFLPEPDMAAFGEISDSEPVAGAVLVADDAADGGITLNPGRALEQVEVTNTGGYGVQSAACWV